MAVPELPPNVQMLNFAFGFQQTQIIYVAAKLNIADLLEGGPLPVSRLAELSGAHAPYLKRVLRTLSALGIFKSEPDAPDVFENTPMSATLTTAAPNSVKNVLLTFGGSHYVPFSKLYDVVKGGPPVTGPELAFGMPFFDWLDERPDELTYFADAMKALSVMRTPAVDALDPSFAAEPGTVIVDIGGGNGSLLASLLARRPEGRGVVFDREAVVGEATELMSKEGLSDRVTVEGGDFFKAVTQQADVYVLSFILHDWSDDECRTILGSIRSAMKPTSKIAILESVVPAGTEMHVSKMVDMTMLGLTTGMERSAAEYDQLLASAGFKVTQIQPTPSPYSWIFAAAADAK